MINRHREDYTNKFVEHGLKVLHIDEFTSENEILGKVKFSTCDIWILQCKSEEKIDEILNEEDFEDLNLNKSE